MKRDNILPVDWLKLGQHQRVRLSMALGLKRSGGNLVERGVLVSDGHTPHDLLAITPDLLVNYLDPRNSDAEKKLRKLDLTSLLEKAAEKAADNTQETHEPNTNGKAPGDEEPGGTDEAPGGAEEGAGSEDPSDTGNNQE